MMDLIDRHAIAARIRRIVGGLEPAALERASAKLGVSELALHMSIDPESPQPTIDVVLAIVRVHRVDPGWLLMGEYDSDTHRLAEDAGERAIRSVFERMARRTDAAPGDVECSLESPVGLSTIRGRFQPFGRLNSSA